MRKGRPSAKEGGGFLALVALTIGCHSKNWFGYSAKGRFCLYAQRHKTEIGDFKTCITQHQVLAEFCGDALRAQFPYTREVRNSSPGPFRVSIDRSVKLTQPREMLSLLYLQICAQERRAPDVRILVWLCEGRVRVILLELLHYLRGAGLTQEFHWSPWAPPRLSELRKFVSCERITTQEFVKLLGTESRLPRMSVNFSAMRLKAQMYRVNGIPPPTGYERIMVVAFVVSDDPIPVDCFYSLCKNEETGMFILVGEYLPAGKISSLLRCLKYSPNSVDDFRYGVHTPLLIETKNIILNKGCLTNKRHLHSGLTRYEDLLLHPMRDIDWWAKIRFNTKLSDITVLDEILGKSVEEDFARLASLESPSWRNRFSGLRAAMLSDVLPLLGSRPDDVAVVEKALEQARASASVPNVGCVASGDGGQGAVAARATSDYAGEGPVQSTVSRVDLGQDNSSPNSTGSQPYTAGAPDKFRELFPWSFNGAPLESNGTWLGRDFGIKRRKIDSGKGERCGHPSTSGVTQEDEVVAFVNPLYPNGRSTWSTQPDDVQVENRSHDKPKDLPLTMPSESMETSLFPPEKPLDLCMYSKKKNTSFRRDRLFKPYTKQHVCNT